MSFLTRIIIQILANSAAIWIADRFVSGFIFQGNFKDLLIAGAVLGIINSFIRPVVKLISLPIIFLTLGLFTIVINIALLLLATNFLPTLEIRGFWAAFWGVAIISLVNHLIFTVVKSHNKTHAKNNQYH